MAGGEGGRGGAGGEEMECGYEYLLWMGQGVQEGSREYPVLNSVSSTNNGITCPRARH